MKQQVKQIRHGLYALFEIASEGAHMIRYCMQERSAGVSVHPELSRSNFQPTGLRCVTTKRPQDHRKAGFKGCQSSFSHSLEI